MCTVSWLHEGGGYQLLCNRDEKKTRGIARPPRIERRDGVAFIAPLDADFSGTWLTTNEFGLTFCLVNGIGPRGTESRGHLVLALATSASLRDAEWHLRSMDIEPFGAFQVVALSPAGVFVASYDGAGEIAIGSNAAPMPLVSSSFEPEAVCAARRRAFNKQVERAGCLDANVLFNFHESHGGRPSAYSACMHRADAETVSFSWIHVDTHSAEFFYTPGSPCQWLPGETHRLSRRG